MTSCTEDSGFFHRWFMSPVDPLFKSGYSTSHVEESILILIPTGATKDSPQSFQISKSLCVFTPSSYHHLLHTRNCIYDDIGAPMVDVLMNF